jgi:hypothetical protein
MTIRTNEMLNNKTAQTGCDRCVCGNKYWENDACIDCGMSHRDLAAALSLDAAVLEQIEKRAKRIAPLLAELRETVKRNTAAAMIAAGVMDSDAAGADAASAAVQYAAMAHAKMVSKTTTDLPLRWSEIRLSRAIATRAKALSFMGWNA